MATVATVPNTIKTPDPSENQMRQLATAKVKTALKEAAGSIPTDEVDASETTSAVTGISPPPTTAVPKRGAKTPPPFKNPLALSEPTKEILVPGIMVFGATILSWVAGRWNFSSLLAIGFGGGVYYAIQTLKERITKAATIFAERNAARKRVVGDDESAEWINAVLYRFWQFYEPVLCQNIRDAVQPQLDANCPPSLTGLKLQRLTLGKLPPFISSAKILLKDNHRNEISEDRIVLNLGIGLHAPDLEVVVAALTPVASLPLAIKNIWFEGKLRIEIELVPEFPHAKTVLVTFLEKPIIDFSVVPLKSVNLFDLPGISQFVTNLIISGINDNLVNPEKLLIDLMPSECGAIHAAKGMMFVTINSADYNETSPLDFMSMGTSEVYCEIKCNREIAKTKPIPGKGTSYTFGETISALVMGNLAAEKLVVSLKQKRSTGEKVLGKAYVPVADVANSPDQTISETLPFEGVEGNINVTFCFRALAKLNVEEGADADVAASKESETVTEVGEDGESVSLVAPPMSFKGRSGALLVRLHQGQDLVPKDSNGFSDPYAKLYYMNINKGKTPVFDKTLAPHFDWSKEFTVADVDHVKFTLRIFDKDTVGIDDPMGDLDIDLSEIFTVTNEATGERNFIVERKWFYLRQPGEVTDKPATAADLKRGTSQSTPSKKSAFGHVLMSFVFRPTDLPAGVTDFSAEIGNSYDDLRINPYNNGNVLGAIGKGAMAGVGAVGAGITGAAGLAVGGVTGAAGLVGKGLAGATNVTGSAGKNMVGHMSNFNGPNKKNYRFFGRKKLENGVSNQQ